MEHARQRLDLPGRGGPFDEDVLHLQPVGTRRRQPRRHGPPLQQQRRNHGCWNAGVPRCSCACLPSCLASACPRPSCIQVVQASSATTAPCFLGQLDAVDRTAPRLAAPGRAHTPGRCTRTHTGYRGRAGEKNLTQCCWLVCVCSTPTRCRPTSGSPTSAAVSIRQAAAHAPEALGARTTS